MEHRKFVLEQLEGRTLLSVTAPMGMAPMMTTLALHAAPRAATANHTPITAAFNIAGTFTKPLGNPDSGTQYQFNGSGKTKALGTLTLTGNVRLPGFVANGKANGRLTLANSKGTIVLSVNGPPQSPGSLPGTLSYSIVSGTGTYAHSTGKGQITVSASAGTSKFLFTFHPGK